MRHLRKAKKLNRSASHRKALMRNLVTSLFQKGRITTTLAKAKLLRGVADHMVTLAKRGNLHARRRAARTLQDETVLKKLFDTIGPEFNGRNGGYTRVLKLGTRRHGDAAELALIELVGYVPLARAKKKAGKGEKAAPGEKEQAEAAKQ